MIARAMGKAGKHGVITVTDGNALDNELEVVEGMKLARGHISPYFITDKKTQKCASSDQCFTKYQKPISRLAY